MRHLSARLLLAGTLVLPGCGGRAAATPATATAEAPSEAERVVQVQLEAYNRRDIDAFAATYAEDVRIYTYPDQQRLAGQAALRARYATLFANAPALRATITRRIVQGAHVIDHEMVTGLPDGGTIRAVAIYEVRGGRIASVRFIQ